MTHPADSAPATALSMIALGIIGLFFIVMKSYALQPASGDENIYLYLASAMAHGELPYRDFFHAHPPLHLLPLAAFYRLDGAYSLLAARLLSGGATLVAGFLIARRQGRAFGVAGVIACALFLTSFDVLRISTHFVGSNLAAFWVALGLERLARSRDMQAAWAFSLGGFTLLNAAPAAVGATLVVAIANPARGLRLAGAGALITLVLNALAVAVCGGTYVEQVYLFHLAKTAASGQSFGVLISIVQSNGLLLGSASLGIVALILGSDTERKEATQLRGGTLSRIRSELESRLPLYCAVGATLASLLFLVVSSRIFVYYVQVLFVCVAPLAGFGLVSLVDFLRVAISRSETDSTKRGEARVGAAILLFMLVASQLSGLMPGRDEVSREGESQTVEHVWYGNGSEVIGSVLRPILWRDVERLGDSYWGLTRFLWHEADWFVSAPRLASEVSRRCGAGETVFGDSTATPLVALLADRKLALGEADTNHLRFSQGDGSASRFIADLEAAPPCAVVFRYDHGLFQLEIFRSWLDRHYRRVFETSNDQQTRRFELYIRSDSQLGRTSRVWQICEPTFEIQPPDGRRRALEHDAHDIVAIRE